MPLTSKGPSTRSHGNARIEAFDLSRDELLKLARDAARNAHCPYSHFRVGAAVIADGKVYTGANVENSSYGLTLCAERTALASAITSGARRITHLAVSCIDAKSDTGTEQLMPCGACRQWLSDLAPDAMVFIDGLDHDLSLSELLPYPFRI